MKPCLFTLLALFALIPNSHAQESDLPPTATSQSAWLFTWTNRPEATTNPGAHISRALTHAADCMRQIREAESAGRFQEIPGCEGNGMAAGPGLYTCDNPFTSHDYGNVLVMVKARAGSRRVANESGLVRPADSMDRAVTGSNAYDAILYDFRPNDAGGYALAVRQPGIVDLSQIAAVKVPPGARKEFHFHPAFACTAQTSLKDILTRWGDQIDFMAITFDSFRDPSGRSFERNGQLSPEGLMAALASNVVAVSDEELGKKISSIKSINAELKEALENSSCREASRETPRMCLANELFDSLVGNEGNPSRPNYSWSFENLKLALLKLGIINAATASQHSSRESLMSFLAARFARDAQQIQRAQEAFGCMKAVKSQLRAGSFDNWANNSATRATSGSAPDSPAGSTQAQ